MAIDQSLLILHPKSSTPVLTESGWQTTVPPTLNREETVKKLSEYLPTQESWSEALLIFSDEFIKVEAGLSDDKRGVANIFVRVSLKKLAGKQQLFKVAETVLKIAQELDLGVWGTFTKKYLATPQEVYDDVLQSPAGKLYQDLLK